MLAVQRESGDMTIDNTPIDDGDPFEQGKRAKLNRLPDKNPYPAGSEQYRRWEAGYKFVEQGLAAV
jgi:hypothetical protein